MQKRKQRQNLVYTSITGTFMFVGLAIYFSLHLSSIFISFGIIIGSVIIGSIAMSLVPDMRYKENKNKNLYTGANNKKKNAPKKSMVKDIDNKKQKKLTDAEILSTDYTLLTGEQFERLCYLYFKDKGFSPQLTSTSGDHGVDLVIKDPKDGLKIAVQCKRWKGNVGNADLHKLEGGKRFYKCPGTLFITTSNYTKKAVEFSEQVRMELWNELHVQDKIGNWQKSAFKRMFYN
ncbi:restriction endonuclease [Metabacillus litoralis]|uniref:restriction endonuclease n=1 Tax=Metabacillus litoralis TaxID=152268 RepID=UPI001B981A78|nr:restriction endonuclease [Metabacillus litoralis]UHA60658.1 restriction endonuclease [Metabacillus litoralis]